MRWRTVLAIAAASVVWLQASAAEAQDLSVSSFTAKVTGTSVTFTAKVCNTGATIYDSFYVDLYYNRTTGPDCGVLGEDWGTVDGLASGACATLTFTRSGTPPGTYTAWARTDSTCDITETNEANNNAYAGYTVSSLPDLVVSSMSSSVSGSTVTYTVLVCNLGASAATDFFIDLYYNRATAPGCVDGDDFAYISTLAAGACTSQSFTRTGTPSGSYLSWANADSTCSVTEADEANNTASTSYTVGSTLPDLNISLSTMVSGSTVTYSATVCNVGSAAAGSFDVDLYYNRATAPGCWTLGDVFQSVSSLAAGSCTTLTFTRTGTASGTYTAWAQVDSTCGVTESNEGNNTASKVYTVNPLPDLRVASFSAFVMGTTVNFSATICNNGTAVASGFWLDLYYDRSTAPACGTLGDDYLSISSLAAGDCVTKTFTRTATPTGTYTGWARVDSGCSVTESNETNNNGSAKYTIGPQLPDLTVTVTTSVNGGTVTFTANVCNLGGATTSTIYLDIYYNRVSAAGCGVYGDDFTTISGLAAGACVQKTFTRLNTPTGGYLGWAQVDSECTVTETDETNNSASSAYSVGSQADLIVQSFTATPSGSTVNFNVNVCNNGGTAVGSFSLALYYNRVAAPTCGVAADQQTTIASLAAGACTTRTFTRSATPTGTYQGWALADAACGVTESDENNNSLKAVYAVALPPDASVPTDLSRPDAAPKPDLTVKKDVTVKVDSAVVKADGAVKKDSAVVKADGAVKKDGAKKIDGGVEPDSGVAADSSSGADSAKADRGKATPGTASGGCGCEVAGDPDPASLLSLALFGVWLIARRRRDS
jgi:MYXO-CTERM domain-containing protein